MSELILQPGFEDEVRAKLAVRKTELPDDVINQPSIRTVAEVTIIKKVGDVSGITDPTDLILLRSATLALICHKLCPTMPNRLKTDVSTLDVKWKRGKVDWDKRAEDFLRESEELLDNLISAGADVVNFVIAKANGDGE